MHPESIGLGIVDGYEAVGGIAHARLVIVDGIATEEHVAIESIIIYDIAECLVDACAVVVEQGVGSDGATIIPQGGASVETGGLCAGVVIGILGLHIALARFYPGGTYDVGKGGVVFVVEGIGLYAQSVFIGEHHVIIELGMARVSEIAPPVGCENVLAFYELDAC